MSKVAIVTDSTAYIPAPVVEDHRITVIPLTVNFDDGSVEDGLGDLRAFFDRRAGRISRYLAASFG